MEQNKKSAADAAQDANEALTSALVIDGMPVRLSYSGIDSWFNCRRAWYDKYVLGLRDEGSHESVVGNFIHDALENFYSGEERSPGMLKETVRKSWGDFHSEYSERFNESQPLTPLQQTELKLAIWDAIDGIAHLEDPSKVKVIENEMALDTTYRGLPLRGFIDRVDDNGDGTVSIIDYKSGKVPAPKYQGKKLYQLYLYGMVLEEMDFKPTKAKLYFTKHKTIIQSEISKKTHTKIRDYIDKAVDEMYEAKETKLFPHKTSPLCGWCPKSADGTCPEGREFVLTMASNGKMRFDAPSVVAINKAMQSERDYVPEYMASYSDNFDEFL